MLKRLIHIAIFISMPSIMIAQELKVNLTINTDAVIVQVGTDKTIYKEMRNAFEEFLNSRAWTKDTYSPHERIEVNLAISITGRPSLNVFTANAQIIVSRPVFGAEYQSILFNYLDKGFDFEYREGQPMEYNDNAYTNNITSLLAYYAYIAIGIDHDSFKEKGGTRYFERALNVVNNAQQSGRRGWSPSESTTNRFWIADNLNSQQLLKYREGYYNYHRLGLDKIIEDPKECQKVIKKYLEDIKQVRRTVPVSILLDNFFDTKVNEIANIFSEGDMEMRKEVFELLRTLDPTNNSKYQKILGKQAN